MFNKLQNNQSIPENFQLKININHLNFILKTIAVKNYSELLMVKINKDDWDYRVLSRGEIRRRENCLWRKVFIDERTTAWSRHSNKKVRNSNGHKWSSEMEVNLPYKQRRILNLFRSGERVDKVEKVDEMGKVDKIGKVEKAEKASS